jgi:hypothetical protein
MSCCCHTLQRICPLSPWLEQWCPQIMVLLLPVGSCKACAIGFGGATFGSHVWGTNASSIKNREEGGALALGGRQSIKTINNQLIVSWCGMWDVRAEAHWGGSAWGDTFQSFGVANWTTKKIIIQNTSWLLAAAGWSFYTQQLGGRRGQSAIATFEGIKIWLEKKTKNIIIELSIFFSWSDIKMILNLSAPPSMNPFRWGSRDRAVGNPIAVPLDRRPAPPWWCCLLDGWHCNWSSKHTTPTLEKLR